MAKMSDMKQDKKMMSKMVKASEKKDMKQDAKMIKSAMKGKKK
jgi:hypothetical protein